MQTLKTIRIFFLLLLFVCLFIFCNKTYRLGNLVTPSKLSISTTISQDESGKVEFVAQADDANVYHYLFEEDATVPFISANGKATNVYTKPGKRKYKVYVIAYGNGGLYQKDSLNIEVSVKFELTQELQFLTKGNRKTWKWKKTETNYFGVGDPNKNFPDYYSASESAISPCMEDDLLTFGSDFSYRLNTGSNQQIRINWQEVKGLYPTANPSQNNDECRAVNNKIKTNSNFSIYKNSAGKKMLSVSSSTLSYFAGVTEYEIIELTDTKLSVAGIQQTPTGALKWYHIFEATTDDTGGETVEVCGNTETANPVACANSGVTGNAGTGNFATLVWADEFNTDGPPCSKNWTYDVGTGSGGWGNNEAQYYTNLQKNVTAKDGILKITAIKESYQGRSYTSARIKTQTLFNFKYGKVEVKAKLPAGGGTWPAIWMLGSNFSSAAGWPACGEIDIMEHVGNDPNTIISALHYPGNSAGNAVVQRTTITNATSVFHVYAMEWNSAQIKFFVDGNLFHTFTNNASIPYNQNFFLLLNVAMGGTLGGNIPTNFNCSTMEIDYVRVYQ